jgi:hypothetical protein
MKFYPHFTALQPYFCELDCTKGKIFYEPNAFILNTHKTGHVKARLTQEMPDILRA